MSFTLIIDIHGLCLFAPHEDTMHVLLPDEAGHGGHGGMGVHLARFLFDAKYNATGSGRTEENFANLRWDLADIVPGGATLTLPPQVVDVAQYVRPRGLEKHQVRRTGQMHVKSHLLLTRGKYLCHGPVPHFRIGPHRDVGMASMLRWVIEDMPGTELPWRFRDRQTDAPAPAIEPLRERGGVIELELRHAPTGIGSTVCVPSKPTHFPAYYPLFKGTGPAPRCIDKVSAGSCEESGLGFTRKLALPAPDLFTCMIGKTPIDPTS